MLHPAAYRGDVLKEVPLADDIDDEDENAAAAAAAADTTVGLAVRRRARRAGGLGKMRDYGKRQAEVPNPYAPPQVRSGWDG